MNRLTARRPDGQVTRANYYISDDAIREKLYRYEELGLEPEEISSPWVLVIEAPPEQGRIYDLYDAIEPQHGQGWFGVEIVEEDADPDTLPHWHWTDARHMDWIPTHYGVLRRGPQAEEGAGMSNRLVKHSSRYSGPMGDSRPPTEIFAGIEAREAQAREYKDKLRSAMDDVMSHATLMSWEGRAELVRGVVIDWLFSNHPDFMDKRGPQSAEPTESDDACTTTCDFQKDGKCTHEPWARDCCTGWSRRGPQAKL